MTPPTAFANALDHWVTTRPAALALVGSFANADANLTWRTLRDHVFRRADEIVAADDAEFGVDNRNTSDFSLCIHDSDSTLETVITALACHRLPRVVECPLDARLPQLERQRRADQLRKSRPAPGTSLVLWTSGTAGTARGVQLSESGLLANAAAKLRCVPQTPDDVRFTVLPISHAYARTCDLGTWLLSGGTLVMGLGWNSIANQFARSRSRTPPPTLMNVVPSLAMQIGRISKTSQTAYFKNLKILGVGGAALSRPFFEQLTGRGLTVIQGYGLTETGPVICSARFDAAIAGHVGPLVDGWQHRIDAAGQLHVRGPALMLGYYGDSGATDSRSDGDGYFATGDRIEVGDDQQWRVMGRIDDVIVLDNGNNIDPLLIEQEFADQFDLRSHHVFLRRGESCLEIWIDGSTSIESATRWRSTLAPWLGQIRVSKFNRPLSFESGELTFKGNLVRKVVETNRFSQLAP